VADPVHQLSAAKGGVMGMNAICSIALIVPIKQQGVLHCFKSWLFVCISNTRYSAASRTTMVISRTCGNFSLPLMAADRALPLSPEDTASKRLPRCLGILVLVPELQLAWCLGSKRAVLTHSPPCTIWAGVASGAAGHICLPDMRASCWTVGARPHDLQVAAWLHLDAAQ